MQFCLKYVGFWYIVIHDFIFPAHCILSVIFLHLCVLGMAGMELMLLMAAHTMLCFGFVTKTVLLYRLFLLLGSVCTASRLPLFLLLLNQWIDQECARGGDRVQAETTQTVQSNIPCHITICSAICKGEEWSLGKPVVFCLRNRLGITLAGGGGKWLPLHHLPFVFFLIPFLCL